MGDDESVTQSTTFSALLRHYRLTAGISQTELAERAGISWRAVTDIERGASHTPHRNTVERLLRALDLAPHERSAIEATIPRRRGPRVRRGGAAPVAGSAQQGPPDTKRTAPAATTAQAGMVASPLPAPPTPFIGRRRDVEAVRALLQRDPHAGLVVRLLTLQGPAGIGKTRLCLRVAQELRDDGLSVTFVPLGSIRDPELMLPTLAHALKLTEVPGQSLLDLIAQHVVRERTVIFLDNLEQIVEAGTEIAALLELCPELQVVATSRAVLHLYGEHIYDVPPLSIPEPASAIAPQDALEFDAVQLFVQRAQAVNSRFVLTAEAAPLVVDMCQHLEGLPLAIELAAARTRLFSVAALRAQLAHRLDVLVGGPRDRPPRQQSLRQAIGWSYDLLDDHEKALFARLAVFAGGWTGDAAVAVCTLTGEASDVIEGLSSLVDKSLVQALQNPAGEARFTMLELIRDYAQECLAARAETERLNRVHAQYVTEHAEELAPRLLGPDQVRWLARLEEDEDNVRAALSWTQEHGEVTLGLRLARALCPFWDMRSRVNEGRRWLEALLTVTDSDESRERQELRAFALRRAGLFASRQGDYQRAAQLYEESLALCQVLGDRTGMAATLNNLGIIALDSADHARAENLFSDSLALRREDGSSLGIAQVLNNLGEVARARSDFVRARAYYEETLVLAQESGQEWGTAIAFLNLGTVACELGDYAQAADSFRQGLSRLRALGDARNAAEGLEGMARVAAGKGNMTLAARLYGAADALHEGVGTPVPPYEQAAHDRRIAAVRVALGDALFTKAWNAGRLLDLDHAVAAALAAGT